MFVSAVFLAAPLWCSFQSLCILHHHFCYGMYFVGMHFSYEEGESVFFLLEPRVKQTNFLDLFHCELVSIPQMQSLESLNFLWEAQSQLSALGVRGLISDCMWVQKPRAQIAEADSYPQGKLQGQLGFSSLFFSCIWVFQFLFLWSQLFF